MALSTDVNLPKDHKARFPNKCVVCEMESPTSSIRIITGTIGWWTWLLFSFGKPFVVRAPACRTCGWRLRFARVISVLVTVGLCFVALGIVVPSLPDDMPRIVKKLIGLIAAGLSVLPQILYEVYFPQPFDVTAKSESVDYEFKNAGLANEFASMNEDAGWVRIE